ncbi:hypothetical protein K435DRAFT_860278 [Dendrothele bispora CBS 962.96]|uniref:Uncharacterized protein n=1 Tax=Dendrothele bispora (strain CBS 962.96) TaxID=1314807 RepID=A0A4S8LYD8_DENBC|nr:hypothetical protein K435DRAFT_860278 [Dendrothele bispora CBS 962.96]
MPSRRSTQSPLRRNNPTIPHLIAVKRAITLEWSIHLCPDSEASSDDSGSESDHTPSPQPPPCSQPVSSIADSKTVRGIVANNLSGSSQAFLIKAGLNEIRNGSKTTPQLSPHVLQGSSKGRGKDKSGSTASKGDKKSNVVKVAGFILNIHGIHQLSGQSEQVQVHTLINPSTIDYYQGLRLAFTPREGVSFDLDLDHSAMTTFLRRLFPVLDYLYPDTDSATTRTKIPKDDIEDYCLETRTDFQNLWISLGTNEGWLDSEGVEEEVEDEHVAVGVKRKRSNDDTGLRTTKILHRSRRLTKGKGKARASSPIESDHSTAHADSSHDESDIEDEGAIVTDLLCSSPTQFSSFDPWNQARHFILN